MDDIQIVELYWRRDEAAIRETDARYGGYCYAVADRILHDAGEAEECVNDTWMRAWNAMPPQYPRQLRMFLARITRNLSFDRFQAKRAAKRGGGELPLVLEELEECLPGPADVEEEVQARELGRAVDRFLHTLSERECGVFLRRYFFVESTGEIAVRFGLKESHVLVILSRTRKKLRRFLEQEGYLP